MLSTDLELDKDQVQALRDRWNEQARGLHQGGTPILTAGLKVQPWAQGGKDAATADMMKLSNEHIALAFRIPLQILGIGGTSYAFDRSADAELDRERARLCAQSHRGSDRPAVRAARVSPTSTSNSTPRRCCARP